MQEFAKEFYNSPAWKKCRKAYLKSQGGLCERCRARGLIVPAEIVHHKIHITPENINNPDIVLNWENLCCVCRDCHGELHSKNERRYIVAPDGQVTILK